MSEEPKEIMRIEVRRRRTEDDPPINIYNVELSRDGGVWPETFGSLELLNAFLRGVTASLNIQGLALTSIQFTLPPNWEEPSGRRWVITDQSLCWAEDLDSEGRVVRI